MITVRQKAYLESSQVLFIYASQAHTSSSDLPIAVRNEIKEVAKELARKAGNINEDREG